LEWKIFGKIVVRGSRRWTFDIKRALRKVGYESGSGSNVLVGFNISGVEPSGSATTVIV
jgi:hypothetical protein